MPATRAAMIANAASRLVSTSDTPRLDAELLMAHALGIPRETMLMVGGDDVPDGFAAMVERRLASEPLAYITGTRAFWTIELAVAPGVLIPRPDSETLIEAAVARFGAAGPARVLDLGTGSGALLLAALDQWPDASGVGIDFSPTALAIAVANARSLGLAERTDFRLGDWGAEISERFDLLLCNPPYVEAGASLPRDVAAYEPAEALFAGPDGLEEYRRLAPQIGRLLAPGGIGCIEVGASQADAVGAILVDAGLSVAVRRDLAGYDRCLIAALR